jgi:hypothetical protein
MTADLNSSVQYYLQQSTAVLLRELKRAGRVAEEQQLYREVIAKADTASRLSSALSLAVAREDLPSSLELFQRLAKQEHATTAKQPHGSVAAGANIAQHFSQWMGKEVLPQAEVLAMLDRYLNYHAAKTNSVRGQRSTRSTSSSLARRSSNYVTVYSGNSAHNLALPYPQDNAFYDRYSIILLRNAFEYFKRHDVMSDLVAHLQQRLEKAPAAEKVYATLALAYIQAWNDEPAACAESLLAATKLEPNDLELRLDAARFYLSLQRFDEALVLVDAVTPVDQTALQQREVLALDLAVRLNDRARGKRPSGCLACGSMRKRR